MKIYYLLIFITSICFGQKEATENEIKAHYYYKCAYKILNNTTSNALSEDLSLKALDYANKAIELNSKNSKYFRVRGTTYFHLKKYDLALNNHDEAIKIDSTNTLAWMGRAIVYENTNQFELAEKNYFKALEYDSNSSIIPFNLGLLYDKWNKPEQSLKSYDKAIQLDSIYADAYINRGAVKLRSKMYEEAINDFNTAISLNSLDKMSYNNRGLCKFYLKEYKSAIDDFEKALAIKLGKSFDENFDTDKYSYNNIANSYFGLGNNEKACEYWNIAVQKGYKYQKKWKEIYNIDDPNELIKKHCK
ncbi:tetratricopeptide repeat protein [Flavobacterium terrigena]|uniref:Tetratricopeptide repeat-containing protein n=1 Tax=Flavobacterium terrigena TaxID=402734 RepID=A0A1H6WCS3_9FLAO|nr:tetratricopeptide repeat protein [Flavobacterium terrigena]SEJ10125.1 Tetratricopeptide repeat-containing protein [Flavobacterium terrigena]